MSDIYALSGCCTSLGERTCPIAFPIPITAVCHRVGSSSLWLTEFLIKKGRLMNEANEMKYPWAWWVSDFEMARVPKDNITFISSIR